MMNFNISRGLVVATVKYVPTSEYFFVQNGEPQQIFCHCNQGGELMVSPSGVIVLSQNQTVISPSVGENIVLIRESNNPSERAFTKASRWAMESDWQEVAWATNAQRIFRAIGYGHRDHGHFMSNTKKDVELVSDKLISIVRQSPRGTHKDPLSSGFSVTVGPMELSYQVRWERLDLDGKWTECADPRPR